MKEELLHRLQGLVGELMILETEAERLGALAAARNLEAARADVVAAVREMEPPLEWGSPYSGIRIEKGKEKKR